MRKPPTSLLPRWIVNVGMKYDNVDIQVDYNVNKGGSEGSNTIQKDFFLPSLNLKYNLSENIPCVSGEQNIYAAASKGNFSLSLRRCEFQQSGECEPEAFGQL